MANKAFAKKKARRDQKVAAQNKVIKKSLKKILKKDDAKEMPQIYRLVDKAAKRRIIHSNKANRLKSRMAKKFA